MFGQKSTEWKEVFGKMQKQYQVTLKCATGQYRPVSTIVTIEQTTGDNKLLDPIEKKSIINKGIIRICQQRYWNSRDVKKWGYTKVIAREYPPKQE